MGLVNTSNSEQKRHGVAGVGGGRGEEVTKRWMHTFW